MTYSATRPSPRTPQTSRQTPLDDALPSPLPHLPGSAETSLVAETEKQDGRQQKSLLLKGSCLITAVGVIFLLFVLLNICDLPPFLFSLFFFFREGAISVFFVEPSGNHRSSYTYVNRFVGGPPATIFSMPGLCVGPSKPSLRMSDPLRRSGCWIRKQALSQFKLGLVTPKPILCLWVLGDSSVRHGGESHRGTCFLSG